jgi:hypothetical protein
MQGDKWGIWEMWEMVGWRLKPRLRAFRHKARLRGLERKSGVLFQRRICWGMVPPPRRGEGVSRGGLPASLLDSAHGLPVYSSPNAKDLVLSVLNVTPSSVDVVSKKRPVCILSILDVLANA